MNEPDRIEYLGDTKINEKEFLKRIKQLSVGSFK